MTAISATATRAAAASRRPVGIWLAVMAGLIAAMVLVGGLTRLTGSGLSITEWQPISGALPPLSHAAWLAEFAHYRQIPQYRFENAGMTLDQFKAIFWWEWAHRLLGRLVGVVFLAPFVWFAWRGNIPRADYPRMIGLFLLGGLQGLVGWWMVKSGLEVRVSVSQYRLAIHLGVALILYAAILWTAFEYLFGPPPETVSRSLRRFDLPALGEVKVGWHSFFHLPLAGRSEHAVLRVGGVLFAAAVYIQMLLGALVAGLHAGLIYNSWPDMNGRLTPEGAFFAHPWFINFFENAGLVQFDHRIGAYLIAAGAVALFVAARKLKGAAKISAHVVLTIVLAQIALGIFTLLYQVPVALAAAHQMMALALFTAAIWHAYETSRVQSADALSA